MNTTTTNEVKFEFADKKTVDNRIKAVQNLINLIPPKGNFRYGNNYPTIQFGFKSPCTNRDHIILPIDLIVGKTFDRAKVHALICHELGHQFWTPYFGGDISCPRRLRKYENTPYYHELDNVVEDIRVDSLSNETMTHSKNLMEYLVLSEITQSEREKKIVLVNDLRLFELTVLSEAYKVIFASDKLDKVIEVGKEELILRAVAKGCKKKNYFVKAYDKLIASVTDLINELQKRQKAKQIGNLNRKFFTEDTLRVLCEFFDKYFYRPQEQQGQGQNQKQQKSDADNQNETEDNSSNSNEEESKEETSDSDEEDTEDKSEDNSESNSSDNDEEESDETEGSGSAEDDEENSEEDTDENSEGNTEGNTEDESEENSDDNSEETSSNSDEEETDENSDEESEEGSDNNDDSIEIESEEGFEEDEDNSEEKEEAEDEDESEDNKSDSDNASDESNSSHEADDQEGETDENQNNQTDTDDDEESEDEDNTESEDDSDDEDDFENNPECQGDDEEDPFQTAQDIMDNMESLDAAIQDMINQVNGEILTRNANFLNESKDGNVTVVDYTVMKKAEQAYVDENQKAELLREVKEVTERPTDHLCKYSDAYWESIRKAAFAENIGLSGKLKQSLMAYKEKYHSQPAKAGYRLNKRQLHNIARGSMVSHPFAKKEKGIDISTEILFLTDISGSMDLYRDNEPSPADKVNRTLAVLFEQLKKVGNNIKVNLAAYDDGVYPIKTASQPFNYLNKMPAPRGGTDGTKAVSWGVNLLSKSKAHRKILICLTDGHWEGNPAKDLDYPCVSALGIETYGVAFINETDFRIMARIEELARFDKWFCLPDGNIQEFYLKFLTELLKVAPN